MSINYATSTIPGDDVAASRDRRILQYLKFVHTLARRLRQRLPASVSLDDLVSEEPSA